MNQPIPTFTDKFNDAVVIYNTFLMEHADLSITRDELAELIYGLAESTSTNLDVASILNLLDQLIATSEVIDLEGEVYHEVYHGLCTKVAYKAMMKVKREEQDAIQKASAVKVND